MNSVRERLALFLAGSIDGGWLLPEQAKLKSDMEELAGEVLEFLNTATAEDTRRRFSPNPDLSCKVCGENIHYHELPDLPCRPMQGMAK